MVIRRFGVWTVARLAGALYGAFGLLIGLVIAAISTLGMGITSLPRETGIPETGIVAAVFGVGAIIVLPILYGVMGVVFGALTAALYNLVAGYVGGIEVNLES